MLRIYLFSVPQKIVISVLNYIISRKNYPPFWATADIFQGMTLKLDS